MTIERADVDAGIIWTLIRAAHRAERALTERMAELDLSPVQFGVLSQLAVETSATNAQLARLCFVRPQTMAGVVDVLRSRGIVDRAGPGGRGRPSKITLTDEGRRLVDRAWPVFLEANAAATSGLTARQAGRLNAALHEVATDAE